MAGTLTVDTTPPAATSYLDRLLGLGGAVQDEYTGTDGSYRQLLHRPAPADVIDRGDSPAQVLFLLELDTERRDHLRALAVAHPDWPAPARQPWEPYIHRHTAAG